MGARHVGGVGGQNEFGTCDVCRKCDSYTRYAICRIIDILIDGKRYIYIYIYIPGAINRKPDILMYPKLLDAISNAKPYVRTLVYIPTHARPPGKFLGKVFEIQML